MNCYKQRMQLRMFKLGEAMNFPKSQIYSCAHKPGHKASLSCLESDEYHFCPADALCFMVWFMAESLQSQDWWVTRPPSLQSLFRHINPESAEQRRGEPGPDRRERTGDAEPRTRTELNNLKTKSCDVWELLARALAWSGRSVSSVLNAKDISI